MTTIEKMPGIELTHQDYLSLCQTILGQSAGNETYFTGEVCYENESGLQVYIDYSLERTIKPELTTVDESGIALYEGNPIYIFINIKDVALFFQGEEIDMAVFSCKKLEKMIRESIN